MLAKTGMIGKAERGPPQAIKAMKKT